MTTTLAVGGLALGALGGVWGARSALAGKGSLNRPPNSGGPKQWVAQTVGGWAGLT